MADSIQRARHQAVTLARLPLFDFSVIDPPRSAGGSMEIALGVVHNRDTNDVLLIVREERIGGSALAFPGGKIEGSDKNPIDAAAREVLEEVGVVCVKRHARIISHRRHPTTDVGVTYVYLPYRHGRAEPLERQIRHVVWKPAFEVAEELDRNLDPRVRLELISYGRVHSGEVISRKSAWRMPEFPGIF